MNIFLYKDWACNARDYPINERCEDCSKHHNCMNPHCGILIPNRVLCVSIEPDRYPRGPQPKHSEWAWCDLDCYLKAYEAYYSLEHAYKDYPINGHPLVYKHIIQHMDISNEHWAERPGRTLTEIEEDE